VDVVRKRLLHRMFVVWEMHFNSFSHYRAFWAAFGCFMKENRIWTQLEFHEGVFCSKTLESVVS
jgi:hypothetical protein